MNPTAEPLGVRKALYALLITMVAGSVAGRILAVNRLYEPYLFRPENATDDQRGPWPKTRPEPMPTHGDNDRSRWDTVRALVDDGTYVIGHREIEADGKYRDTGIITQDGWKTIDKVLRPDTHDFYSSKPPLLATLVAGEYWLLKKGLGWSITEDRWSVVRTILLTINGLPFLIYLALLARLLERLGTTDWGRLFIFGAAAFATMLTSFAITFNNHSVATVCALFGLYPALLIWHDRQASAGRLLAAGFFAGLTAATELPALAFLGLLFLFLAVRWPGRTLACFVPAALVPIAGFLLTNYMAVGSWRPAYGEFGGPWYEFEGSFWKINPGEVKHGIDWAYQVESRAGYAFNILIGHHGLFTLTPILVLSAIGMLVCLSRRRGETTPTAPSDALRWLGVMTLLLSVIVVGFYIGVVNDRNRNYGGWTSGLRWLMWLTPFWLLSMIPVADWLARRRWGRGLAYVLLAVSVLSVSYPVHNPWRHPWIYQYLESRGAIPY